MKARVFVTLKPSVFDPQGRTIAEALHSMGYTGVGDVRQGKYFELDVDSASAEQARAVAADIAHRLLANPVIETYRIEVDENSRPARSAADLPTGASRGAGSGAREAGRTT